MLSKGKTGRSMSPPKRRAHRSASSSSLIAPVVTKAHVRRLSRVPSANITPSSSSGHLPRLSSHHNFPMTPDCEPDLFPPQPIHRAPLLSDHPLSLPRLGAAVDALFRPPAKGKPPRPHDPPALFILFGIFVLLFVLLTIALRCLFPSTLEVSQQTNLKRFQLNVDRIHKNLTPLQFWPLPDSSQRSQLPLPTPLSSNVSIQRIWETRFLASRHIEKPPLRLSIVAACKDRTAFLQTALPAWLSMLHPKHDEIILVDWATSAPDFVPLSEVVRASSDSRISVVTLTQSASPWVLSRAYNLGFSLVRGEWILKLDCDTYITESSKFLNKNPLPSIQDGLFYRFDWSDARDKNEEHLNGIFLARSQHIFHINGYDERITTYGWEDSDLYTRLEKSNNLKPVSINRDTVKHMPHDDNLRGSSQHLSMGPILETQVNSQASEGLPSWSMVGQAEKTIFELNILSRDARFLSATMIQTPGTLMEMVSSTRRDAIVTEAVNRVLHDGYGIPWSSISELDQSKEHIVRVLATGGSRGYSSGRKADSVVFALLEGSIPDKILGLASAIMFASTYGRPLFLTWGDGCTSGSSSSACKVGDFFDIESDENNLNNNSNSNATKTSSSTLIAQSSRPIFHIARWKCTTTLHECGSTDPAFNTMEQFCTSQLFTTSSTSLTNDVTDSNHNTTVPVLGLNEKAKQLQDLVEGNISGKKQHVLLHLTSILPFHDIQQVELFISSLKPSQTIQQYVQTSSASIHSHIGVYIASSLSIKSVDLLIRRIIQSASQPNATYFLTGPNLKTVHHARNFLQSSQSLQHDLHTAQNQLITQLEQQNQNTPINTEASDTARQIAELIMLSRCSSMINDGRPSQSVLSLISAFRH